MKSFIVLAVCLSAVIAAPLDYSNDVDIAETVLHAEKGDDNSLTKLIDSGTDVHSINNDELTSLALHKAAAKGNEKAAKILIEKGVNVNSQDHAGLTPLHIASLKGHQNIVQLLIKNKADVNMAAKDGSTPLHVAFEKQNVKVKKTLFQNGADMMIENKNGDSVFDMSIKQISNGASTLWYGFRESTAVRGTREIASRTMSAIYNFFS